MTNPFGPDLKAQQPQLYENLIRILTPQDQQVIQSVVAQADALAAQAQAIATAQAAQQASAGAGNQPQANGTTIQTKRLSMP